MGLTLIEKILANHSDKDVVKPGEIIDIEIDVRAARDFGGANVVKNLVNNGLEVDDVDKTFFTFDCNPTGSDQKYAANQQYCRLYAREKGIKVYDIDAGIGTHLVIEKGLAYPGCTVVSTDSHANILGAIGAFGQGMGDRDIAAAWANGKSWFKVPKSVKLTLKGKRPANIYAKDIVLNLLNKFGANKLLGYSVEVYGDEVDKLTLDERITISSMATEMGAIIVLFPPNDEVIKFAEERSGKKIEKVLADADAVYDQEFELDLAKFVPMMSRPGHPDDTIDISELKGTKIDSAFIGSCTNGRYEDMKLVSEILKGRKVAPGVVLKIVPATDEIWQRLLQEGIIKIFKDAGALVSNAGCAGCAAGQVGQNGPGEVTVSTGNRNFAGKQGKGKVYLGSPAEVAASAVAGYITTPDDIPDKPAEFSVKGGFEAAELKKEKVGEKPSVIEGKVWIVEQDDIDTDMIFHNRYLTITDINEMGQYAFDNLEGWEDFAKKAEAGDIIITNKNFGAGSSRQQAVDCFKALGVQAIIAESFGAIYERNAINAGFPILTYKDISELELKQRDKIKVDFESGQVTNLENGKTIKINPFFDVQMEIYKKDGLLK
ncbi:MAG: 3-isopropylmalate dehydratase large subunit [Candidatus Cloacimonetes bacterium]|nr:3-isopropylmalate dehydratase large subunit [Candidatus Cloacimonadota bacterium]MCF7813334.1 3-isopropylmalate dehydratase large subunit [Candidatus Cloacimonadota bacterium]MCF7867823.1 3-isopropylmalate dehydratase large subunit [Candidatus Cloacimonadota bacterium]MCF7883291.1 3-isopropylmalate dehydratase large subunit [Candidatus Cloacimonadota bacterium]